jgi:hypothetical protein
MLITRLDCLLKHLEEEEQEREGKRRRGSKLRGKEEEELKERGEAEK